MNRKQVYLEVTSGEDCAGPIDNVFDLLDIRSFGFEVFTNRDSDLAIDV